MNAKVTKVDRFTLQVPFVDRVRTEMERAGVHTWSELEITRVETDADVVGWGETIQNYTWGRVRHADRVIGKPPAEMMWDDSLGAGLQMALFDAAGKLAGVPVYRLLGTKCRDWCAISFWDHDMSPEKYEVEAQVAVELGYTCIKIKTRPWFDVRETIQRISDVTPADFRIDADWNAFLNNASNAVPLLRELDADALEKYRVEKADHALPKRLIKVTRPGGVHIYFVNSRQKWVFYGKTNQPVDEWGCSTELIDDDGSAEFVDLHARASEAPVVTCE